MEGFGNNTDTLKEETYLRKTIITDLSEISEELPKFSEKEKIDLAVSLYEIKDFSSLPKIIKYHKESTERLNKGLIPDIIDINPKPIKDNEGVYTDKFGEIEEILIILGRKKFKIKPILGSIRSYSIQKGNLSLDMGKFIPNLEYDTERLKKNLIKMREGIPDKNGELDGFPGVTVKLVK